MKKRVYRERYYNNQEALIEINEDSITIEPINNTQEIKKSEIQTETLTTYRIKSSQRQPSLLAKVFKIFKGSK